MKAERDAPHPGGLARLEQIWAVSRVHRKFTGSPIHLSKLASSDAKELTTKLCQLAIHLFRVSTLVSMTFENLAAEMKIDHITSTCRNSPLGGHQKEQYTDLCQRRMYPLSNQLSVPQSDYLELLHPAETHVYRSSRMSEAPLERVLNMTLD